MGLLAAFVVRRAMFAWRRHVTIAAMRLGCVMVVSGVQPCVVK
jgi:hypothetical protein